MRNSAFGLAASLMIKIVSFVFSVLVVRQLGAQDYGEYAAVLAFVSTFAIFSDLGLATLSVRQVARWRDQPDWRERSGDLYANVVSLRLVLSLFTSVAVIAFAWITGRQVMIIGAIALNSLSLFLYAVQGANESMLAGFERLDAVSSLKVISQVVFLIAGAVVLVVKAGYYGLIGANLLSVLVLAILCQRSLRGFHLRFARPSPAVWLPLLKASLPLGIIGFALGLSYKLDSVLLNIYRGDTETGFYNAAYNLIFTAVMLSNVFNTSLFPSMTRRAASHPAEMPRIIERVFRYLFVAALPVAVGGWALSGQIIPFLYTSSFAEAVPAFSILIWVVPWMYVSEFFGYLILIQDREKSVARAIIISSGFNGLMNLILIPRYGFMAASVMTVLTEILLVGQYVWILRKTLRAFNGLRTFLMPLLSTAVMCGVVLVLGPRLSLFVNIGVGGVVYIFMLLLTGVLGKDEVDLVRSFLRPGQAAAGD